LCANNPIEQFPKAQAWSTEKLLPFSFVNPICEVPVEKHKKFSKPKLGNTNFHF